jgi:EmrB/QacA subfamily drug resistance transporter
MTPPSITTPGNRRALYVLSLAMLMAGMDNTIVNVALPQIGRAFDGSVAQLQWTVAAYVLVLGSLQIAGGSFADRLGRRRVFQTGLALFTVASLLCSLAPGLGWLVAFRAVQAIGGAMLSPVALSIIRNVFHDHKQRARALGFWGSVAGLSVAVGPVVGGLLVQWLGWRSIFWVNVPVGVAALLLVPRFVPESRAALPRRLDPAGQILVIATLGTLIYSVIEGPDRGWLDPLVIGMQVLAALGAIFLGLVENRLHQPLLELRFFASVPFTGASLIAFGSFFSLTGFLFLNTLYLQDDRGMSALTAGLCTTPMALLIAVMSPVAGRLNGHLGPRLPLILAGFGLAASGAALAQISAGTPLIWLAGAYALFGAGFGLQNPVVFAVAVSGMPPAQAGLAAGIASTARQVGAAIGVAILGATINSRLHGQPGAGVGRASHLGWWIITGIGLAIAGLGWLSTTGWAARTAAAASREVAEAEAPEPVTTR